MERKVPALLLITVRICYLEVLRLIQKAWRFYQKRWGIVLYCRVQFPEERSKPESADDEQAADVAR